MALHIMAISVDLDDAHIIFLQDTKSYCLSKAFDSDNFIECDEILINILHKIGTKKTDTLLYKKVKSSAGFEYLFQKGCNVWHTDIGKSTIFDCAHKTKDPVASLQVILNKICSEKEGLKKRGLPFGEQQKLLDQGLLMALITKRFDEIKLFLVHGANLSCIELPEDLLKQVDNHPAYFVKSSVNSSLISGTYSSCQMPSETGK